MTSRKSLLLAVLFLAVATVGCGNAEAPASAATQPAPPPPSLTGTESAPVASSPAATPKAPLAVAPPGASATPETPLNTEATPPQAPSQEPAAATSAPPPGTMAEKQAATPDAAPSLPTAERPKGKITLPAKLGPVTFDHEKHAGTLKIACVTCHHPSRPEKGLQAPQQACRDCHTSPATPPMKTGLRAAFHDPLAKTGTCVECHKQKGGTAPVKCQDCHKKK